MRIAVGQRETANTLRVQCRKNLRDACTAVIADEINLIDLQSVEEFLEHLRVGGHRNVLIGSNFCVAVGQKVHSNAPTDIGQIRELVPPQISVQ